MDKSNLGDHVNLCVGCGLCLRWCLVWNLNPSPYMAPIPCLITHHVPIKMIFSTHCDCKNAPHVLRYPLICTYAEFQDCASIFIAKAGFSTSKWCLEYNEHNIGCAIYRHASYRWKSGCDLPQKKKKKSGCASETGIVISQFSSSNWDDLFNFLALCSALLRKILSFFTAILSCGCVCILGRHVMVQIQLVYVM